MKNGTKRKAKSDEQEGAVEEKPKRGRPKKTDKTEAQAEAEAEPVEKPKHGRKKAAEKK